MITNTEEFNIKTVIIPHALFGYEAIITNLV